MRSTFALACLVLLARVASAEDAPERFKLHWGFAKGMKLEQTVTVHGEADAFGDQGLSLEVSSEATCTKSDGCDFVLKTLALKGSSGGSLALKLDYQDGAWKEASAGGSADDESIAAVKGFVEAEIEMPFYWGDDTAPPGKLLKAWAEMKAGLLLDTDVPGFAGGRLPPTFGLGLHLPMEPEVLEHGVPVGESWTG